MEPSATIADATEATFQAEVVDASATTPVVVDFWAAWCGPCKQLSPLLERVAERFAGEVKVVKVDVDSAPNLARSYGIQGIPAVKAFRDGQVVSEFVGLQPERNVERFFAALLPSPADRLVAEAGDAPADTAEPLLRQALELQSDHPGAVLGLAGLLADRGATEEALALLARVPDNAAARRMVAELNMAERRGEGGDLAGLRAQAADGDAGAQLELGRVLAAGGDYEEALEALLSALREPEVRDAARATLLEVFTVLGEDHELVKSTRPRMASALFV